MLKRLAAIALAAALLFTFALAEDEELELIDIFGEEWAETLVTDEDPAEMEAEEAEQEPAEAEDTVVNPAREDFINRIIDLGQQLYEQTGGRAQRAHYASDIYVCKNFTVYLFRKTRDDFRMAEYPDVSLVIPDNLPAKQCKPYAYGFLWKDIAASEGNPFYVAAQFIYNAELSEEENMELAVAFMREVKRGDYFQMSAKYEYGTGAHSAIMISDYDPATDTVHWMDSNMRGKKVKGIRYGIVQFNEEKSVEWWAKCFCHKKRGATLYRLRDDIIYADGAGN